MAAQYDISIDQGSNFNFWFQYLDENNIGINLSGYNTQMVIKKYKDAVNAEILVNIYGLTYGCTGGFNTGYTGYGQVYVNTNYNSTYLDGGVKIIIGPKATESLSQGKYLYDIKMYSGNGVTFAQKLVEGKITVNGSNQ